MNYAVELAKELKSRNNENKIGTVIGTVLNINPLKIGIINNQIIVDKNNAYITDNLGNALLVNDKVLVIASENNQTFFIINKMTEVV